MSCEQGQRCRLQSAVKTAAAGNQQPALRLLAVADFKCSEVVPGHVARATSESGRDACLCHKHKNVMKHIGVAATNGTCHCCLGFGRIRTPV